jgi:MoaA/NifB/PqqE/SkfB family radical SAM enzyme
LVLTGGEPTLWDGLIDLVHFSKKRGIKKIELQTNAVLLSDKNMCKRLAKVGLNSVQIAFPSFLEKVSDEITRLDGAFEKRCAGIRNCLDVGLEVKIITVINSKNYTHLLEHVDFINRNFKKIKQLQLWNVCPVGRAENESIVPKLSSLKPFLHEALLFCKKNKIPFSLRGIPLCFIKGFEGNAIDLNKKESNTYIVEFTTFTKKESDKAIIRDERAKNPKCIFCLENERCPGVWNGYKKLYGTSELFPIT